MSNKRRNKELLRRHEEKTRPLYELHSKLFPEEYDCQYDSHLDSQERKRGINPMSEEYQLKVNLRRFVMGVEPFEGTVGVENTEGLISSYDYCLAKLQQTTE